ncbi:glutamine amidotransferase-related protein [Tabrizicola sp. M-4]|uniref:glutamine amidotransferase-related protein n=1 Tax=Tabrizicola sp. M-4 TaxID=3055847 RepID=UPI003DA87DB5
MPARKLVLVRHGDDPPDDRVVSFAVMNGFDPVLLRPFKGDVLPTLDASIAGSVIYGGPFSVFEEDRHPFLRAEADWIRACMANAVPLLGICQGAQQIARVMGAEVGPPASGLHEFGYYPVSPTEEGRDLLPETLYMTQAHYHTFAIPDGAVHLATSPLYPNQAFRIGDRTFGFQFHPECTIEGFRRWQSTPWAAYGKPGAQTRAEQDALMLDHDARQAEWFYAFLARLFGSN